MVSILPRASLAGNSAGYIQGGQAYDSSLHVLFYRGWQHCAAPALPHLSSGYDPSGGAVLGCRCGAVRCTPKCRIEHRREH